MIRDASFAFGVVISLATQLRPFGMPIGPGEILLFAWLIDRCICYAPARDQAAHAAVRREATRCIGGFWLAILVALSIGSLVGMSVETFFGAEAIVHDVLAYALMAALSLALIADLSSPFRRRRMIWLVTGFGALLCAAQLAHGFGVIQLPAVGGIDPWYFDRLRGWAKDPNQLGFLAALLVFLLLHLLSTTSGRRETLFAVALLPLVVSVGILTRSDTFVLSSLIGTCVFVSLGLPTYWADSAELRLLPAVIMIVILALPLMLVAAIPFAHDIVNRAEEFASDVYKEDHQGDTRFMLWEESISKGLDSYLLGFGPGPHLTSKSWKRPPPAKFESHNAPLHLLTQGGLLAVIALLALFTSSFLSAARSGLPALAALVAALFCFSLFHVVYRHPAFWFAIVTCSLEAAATRSARTGIGRKPGAARAAALPTITWEGAGQ